MSDDATQLRKRRAHEADQWYKRYARDFFDDTRELTLEERGAYCDIIDLIYMQGGPLPDREKSLAHRLCIDVRKWRRLRKRLLADGKLFITRGHLYNKRAKEVLDQREIERRSMGDRGGHRLGVQADLFGKDSNFNAPERASSLDKEIDKKKEDRSLSFEPRVIDGGKSRPAQITRFVSEDALDKVRKLAPGYDRQWLLKMFLEWPESKTSETDMDTLFLRWAPKFIKKRGKSA